jgi:MFS family permease
MSALTGCTTGALWAVQNWVATFYPEEGQKGRYIFVNWSVIKTGAVIGSLIALGLNANRTKASVAWQLYLIYFLIMVTATIAAFFVAKPETVRRNDGTALARFRVPTLKEEMVGIWEALKTPQILLMLLPLFVAESYLAPHSSVNGYTFTLRARSLNNVLYWFIEIPAGFVHFKIADATRFSRRTRAFMLTTFVGIVVISGFIGAMVMVTESDFDNRHKAGPGIDWTSDRYGSRCFLYIVWGAGYGLFFQLRLW